MTRRGAQRLRNGHPWVYRSDVRNVSGADHGGVVSVQDEQGRSFGLALYSSASQIALRSLSTANESDLAQILRERIRAAIAYRRSIVVDSDAYRAVFSEADLLPGLIADKYNDIVTFQVLTQALDPEPIRNAIVQTLVEELEPSVVVERVEPRIRELEQLPERESSIVWKSKDSAGAQTVFTLNGVKFQYDAVSGQKTGAFLDQRENYAAAQGYARGRALDVCTYHGGFALHLNRVCESVTAVDVSRPALEVADSNLALNGGREIEWIEANAFEFMKDYATAGEQYDTIVLDPPAFAKGKSQVESAVRGYKELNLRALKMTKPGGVLVTCSCSHHVSESEFVEMLGAAAIDARRSVRVIEKRTQSKDHPILLNVPETYYLKCLICSVA